MDYVINGLVENHYESGQLCRRAFWVNNKIHGDYIAYRPNGNIRRKANYKHGNVVGYTYGNKVDILNVKCLGGELPRINYKHYNIR